MLPTITGRGFRKPAFPFSRCDSVQEVCFHAALVSRLFRLLLQAAQTAPAVSAERVCRLGSHFAAMMLGSISAAPEVGLLV